MINPFNSNFFRFALGFAAILSVSFGLLVYVSMNIQEGDIPANTASVEE